MKQPTWNEFIGKNQKDLEGAFEALARHLFRTRYRLGDSFPYFKNHVGNETATIKDGEDVIGFQAKYFIDGKINTNNILHSLTEAIDGNPQQTKYIIYTNSAFGNPTEKGGNKTKGKKK
ncbi:MAG: hypothetical protein LKI18_08700 [Prevotella sp.]|jgi:hypothetical protein|nr:hypothetical protein [Prevotella sp.]